MYDKIHYKLKKIKIKKIKKKKKKKRLLRAPTEENALALIAVDVGGKNTQE